MELNRKLLDVWIDPLRKTSIELPSTFLLIEKFIFGLHNQFLGCIENVTYNRQLFTFKHLPFNRQQCPMASITETFINQIISFNDHHSPLIIPLTNLEDFQIFSLFFTTEQSNSVICSLVDQTSENILMVIIENTRLVLIYYRQDKELFRLSINQSITDRQQHQIILTNKLSFDLDGMNILEKNFTEPFLIHRITLGKSDTHLLGQSNEKFLGCMEDVRLNDKPLIQFEHLDQTERLIDRCSLTNTKGKINNLEEISWRM